MAKTENTHAPIVNGDNGDPSLQVETDKTTRRNFLGQALTATSGLALSSLLPTALEAAVQTPAPACAATQTLARVGEIKSGSNNILQAVITVKNENRAVPGLTAKPMLRYLEGHSPDKTQQWPQTSGVLAPGPTLRAGIGDTVQITLLNQVQVSAFGGSLDLGEQGYGCNATTKISTDPATGKTITDKNWYPSIDTSPNCLHGSSTSNLHFHGTHVTPSTLGDNVLIGVRPSPWATVNGVRQPVVTEDSVKVAFQQIFNNCQAGHGPQKWQDFPQSWQTQQETLLKQYDNTSPWQGVNGATPEDKKLWPQDQMAIDQGVWPQWYIGAYPYCFKIPKYTADANGKPTGTLMGQSPGTHWYHAHKHGSTAINLFNGLAGALILTDTSPTGYDGKWQRLYNPNNSPDFEVVLIFQQITDTANLLSAVPAGPPPTYVNGQSKPTLNMRPGEIKLLRMINATVQGFITIQFPPLIAGGKVMAFRQVAQDGVQFAWENYNNPLNGTKPIKMAPANRIDLLVQAPSEAGCYAVGSATAPLMFINVTGSPVTPKMQFPESPNDYPTFPAFLADIDPNTIRVRREVVYGWEKGRTGPGRNAGTPLPSPNEPPNAPPRYNIDGKQFEDQIIDQVMLLNSAEEWTIYNGTSAIAHPFHIHVNPFQIIEVFDPATMTCAQPLQPPYVWWDTFGIPAASNVYPDGSPRIDPVTRKQVFVPGYFKMRSRFTDFTGIYVNHCHILAHEDRGMMQLVEVVSNRTILKHH